MTEQQKNRMEFLVKTLNEYARQYYVLDAPTVSDKQYDELYDELKKLEEKTGEILFDSPTKRVGGDPITAFKKHKHIARLYSLDKATSPEELRAFFARAEKVTENAKVAVENAKKTTESAGNVTENAENVGDIPVCTIEYKFDGLTMCLTYDEGKFVRATTRGNGIEGEDVTAQVLTIKSFPLTIKYKGLLEVKGEAIIRLSVLEKYNETAEEPLKNARNAAAGAIRNLDPKVTEKRKPEIYFYDVNYIESGEIESQTQAVEFLKENGFKVFGYLKVVNLERDILNALDEIEKDRKKIDVLTDGAVIKINDFSVREELGETEKFPRWAIAYKFEPEETTTILNEVVWQVGRTGKLTPLALLEPVELCGVTVRKATLNNYDDIKRKKITKKCRVLIHRSNEVIPEILGSTEIIDDSPVIPPSHCPECGGKIEQIGANLFCVNKDCKKRVVLSLANYAGKDAMDIDGFSEATASVLFDKLNVRQFADLYTLKAEELTSLEGFQQKKANNLIAAVEKSKKRPLERFIYALGIDGVGKKTAKDLAKKFKSLTALKNADKQELSEIRDVGEVIAENVAEYFENPLNLEGLEKLEKAGVFAFYEDNVTGKKFAGQKVVLTGTLNNYKRSEAQKIIESEGGEVVGSVSKLTTLVLAGEEAGSKLDKARALGIKVISETEFEQILKDESNG